MSKYALNIIWDSAHSFPRNPIAINYHHVVDHFYTSLDFFPDTSSHDLTWRRKGPNPASGKAR